MNTRHAAAIGLAMAVLFLILVGGPGPATPQPPAGILADGSSTVFPITELAAAEFQRERQNAVRVSVKIFGTGGGFKKFCRGETVDLPALDLTLVHRSDGSGTTYILADYLSKVSADWRGSIGRGTSLRWPVGIGAKGNEGVVRQVKRTAGSLGYAELTYAVANRLPVALIRNKAGRFVEPSLQSTTAAAAAALGEIPRDFRASLTDSPGEATYPIVSFTWALVYQEQADEAKGKALVNFLWWATRDGQVYARDLSYAPLPLSVVSKVEAKLHEVSHRGRPILVPR